MTITPGFLDELRHRLVLSDLVGRKVQWDPKKERFVGDPEADAMISRKMRAPWSLYES